MIHIPFTTRRVQHSTKWWALVTRLTDLLYETDPLYYGRMRDSVRDSVHRAIHQCRPWYLGP